MKSVACLCACLAACPSLLANPLNVRPVSPLGDNGVENTLQETLDGITVSGHVDAISDQTPYAIFTNQSSGGAVASFVIELTGGAAGQTFGIYRFGAPAIHAEIFSGVDSSGSQALVTFLANGDVRVNGVSAATGLGRFFGFYLKTITGQMLYSEDSLNTGGPQALTYRGDDTTVLRLPGFQPGVFSRSEWIIAFDDETFPVGDRDFQDAVVLVESIEPVPEPAVCMLALLGLGRMVLARRRQASI